MWNIQIKATWIRTIFHGNSCDFLQIFCYIFEVVILEIKCNRWSSLQIIYLNKLVFLFLPVVQLSYQKPNRYCLQRSYINHNTNCQILTQFWFMLMSIIIIHRLITFLKSFKVDILIYFSHLSGSC